MKREPKVIDKLIAGWFYMDNGTEYQLIVFNDDDDSIPHYYLTNKKEDFYCGFEINNCFDCKIYDKDRHNLTITDPRIIKCLKECLNSRHKFTNEFIYDSLKFCWDIMYE